MTRSPAQPQFFNTLLDSVGSDDAGLITYGNDQGDHMLKFAFIPPQDDLRHRFAPRLADTLPEYDVAAPETDEEAAEEIKDAGAAMGRIPPDALNVASMVRWLHNPNVGPFVGYYYQDRNEHPLPMTNPRGIYFDNVVDKEKWY